MIYHFSRRDDLKNTLFIAGLFAFFMLFFTQIHPLVIYDTDDLLYMSFSRRAIPLWKDWNPSRVMPEVLFPFVTMIGSRFFLPFTKDLINALIITYGVLLAGIITMYFWTMNCLLRKKLSLSDRKSMLITALFVILHFIVFTVDRSESQNLHMFSAPDVTCYFYYVIPSLLHLILIAKMETNPDAFDFGKNSVTKKMVLCFLAYFACFSNLFSSYILTIWVGLKVLEELWHNPKGFRDREKWDKYAFHIMVIVLWMVSAIYELEGGRASVLRNSYHDQSLMELIRSTSSILFGIKNNLNSEYIVFVTFAAVIPLWAWIRKLAVPDVSFLGEVAAYCALALVYLILLCAKTTPAYIVRPDVMLGLFWGINLLFLYFVAVLLKRYEKLLIILPIYLVFLMSVVHTDTVTFQDSNTIKLPWQKVAELDRYYIDTVLSAAERGEKECVIEIPVNEFEEWPLGKYAEDRWGKNLYAFGLIDYPIKTVFRENPEINEQFHLDNYRH